MPASSQGLYDRRQGNIALPQCVVQSVDELLGGLVEILGGFLIEFLFEVAGEVLSELINGPNATLEGAWWNTLKL